MNLTISGHHVEVTPAMREYVHTKLERMPYEFEQPPMVNVTFGCAKRRQRDRGQCITISFQTKGEPVVVVKEDEDMYRAVDRAVDALLLSIEHKQGRRRRFAKETIRRHPVTA